MSLNMNSYMPVRLFSVACCVQKNGKEFTKYGKKALIVTGQTSARVSGALKDVTAVLVQNHIDYTLFDDITQNPMLIDCMRAAAVAVWRNGHAFDAAGGVQKNKNDQRNIYSGDRLKKCA